MSFHIQLLAYCTILLSTLGVAALEKTATPVAPSYLEKLVDRVPELFTAIIVLWLVFRFLEHSHAKVVSALDNVARATTSLEEFLRERLKE